MSIKTIGKTLSVMTLIVAGVGAASARDVQANDVGSSDLIQATAVNFANLSTGSDSDFLAVRADDDTLVEHHHHDAVGQNGLGIGTTFNV